MVKKRCIRTTGLFISVILLIFISTKAIPNDTELSRDIINEGYEPKRIALIIGINEFKDPNWRTLHFAVKDAEDMADTLGAPDVAYFDMVIKLVDPWETTRDGILEALQQIDNHNMGTEDTILIYISTHGTLARDDNHRLQQYLVARDTEFDNVSETGIEFNALVRMFNQLTSRRKVLILATCHSGMGKSELPSDIQEELAHLKSDFFVKPLEVASEASVIIGASSWGETAQEDPRLRNDIYTYFFLEGMRENDRNEDGAVSLSEAHDYAQRQTYYYTKGQQRPFARSDIMGMDPIILTGRIITPGKPVVFSYSPDLTGSVLSLNGLEKGSLPDGFTTKKGWNRIRAYRQDSGAEIFNGLLYVREGERVDFEELLERKAGPDTGFTATYRMMGSDKLAQDVIPDLFMYGMAYQVRAFPFSNTNMRLEACFGQADWEAESEDGYELNVSAGLLSTSAAIVYSQTHNRAEYFAGPLIGGLFLYKELEDSEELDSRESGTFYPGLTGGVMVRLTRDVSLELSDCLAYQYFNVNDKLQSTLVNSISAAIYLKPQAILRR